MGIWGPLISAGTSLLGGLLGRKSQNKMADKQAALQKEFAQSGIQWRVEDAKKAGIHPLYALGAQTASFSPVSVGDPLGGAFSDMGQHLGRAVDAMGTREERAVGKVLQHLQLERAGLENDLLRTQIASEKARKIGMLGPALPGDTTGQPGEPLYIGGTRIDTDPMTTSGQVFQNRYGEPAEWLSAPVIAWQDLKKNVKDMTFWDILRWIDAKTKVFGK